MKIGFLTLLLLGGCKSLDHPLITGHRGQWNMLLGIHPNSNGYGVGCYVSSKKTLYLCTDKNYFVWLLQ